MSTQIFIQVAYLICSAMFILGIKLLGNTKTAKKGNTISAVAMLLAILATLLNQDILSFVEIFICLLVGSGIGLYYAQKVEMTSMPQMVAIFNGLGGASSMFVALSEYWRTVEAGSHQIDIFIGVTMILGVLIGAVTLTGSFIAFGKLQGIVSGRAITFKGQHVVNALLFVVALVASVLFLLDPSASMWLLVIVGIALLLGILTVIPIGGADMPVVVSLLNSYSGIAACATGFVLQNNVLIIAGALVGASGLILTNIMCKGMNRSLINVLLGGFGNDGASQVDSGDGTVMQTKEVGIEESAMIFDAASSVIIIPGYGMAVAQAQHIVRELGDLLEKKGIQVRYAIHPVAGRMPGHMNVLLAEANVSYDKLVEMDEINNDFSNTDVAVVIGANDVVNPAAENTPGSPIYGMPILHASKARTVIVSKRSMNTGYAGIQNELFGYENCLMLFGDAKETFTKVVKELKDL